VKRNGARESLARSGVAVDTASSRRSWTTYSGGTEKKALTMRTGVAAVGYSGHGGAVNTGPLEAASMAIMAAVMLQWCLP